MIEIIIVIVIVVGLVIFRIMDYYSTETLLNLYVLWHENPDYRKKLEEFNLRKNPLDAEKNLVARTLIKKYGIHKGLTYADIIAWVVLGVLIAAIIHGVVERIFAIGELIIYLTATFFVLGFIFNQFLQAVMRKRVWEKIEK